MLNMSFRTEKNGFHFADDLAEDFVKGFLHFYVNKAAWEIVILAVYRA